ncbi:hypothetical protein SmJEL517_g05879 [Synchytrium microbalum]|uniref:Lysosomal dipeptide transporter MFSD1 n=1 Tax=Synchytrium microbalum TaxID=1806994 RepID=A0A507BXR6_9FUNG|nr:uncharacterized protein SmJEL517_g05879 [Synchytrium microbalum]TPX30584.1 hypothetical protein SmJEL517_g05879 [Synchytrium microbalum]
MEGSMSSNPNLAHILNDKPPVSPSKSLSFAPLLIDNNDLDTSIAPPAQQVSPSILEQPSTPLSRNPSLRHLGARRRSSSLLRRSSSFGGAPIVIIETIPPPGDEASPYDFLSSSGWRWLILILSCLLLFGNYYAYDLIAALNRPMQEWLGSDYDTYQYQLNLLYSVYSFPNMFLPFLGGQLVDKVDSKKVLILFSLFVCIGQTIFAIGVSSRQFGLMVLGRILFGIGGESISVVQASITTSWFKGKELAFALGLNLCIARFGSVANSLASPRIEVLTNVPTAVWAGTLMCYLSFGASMALVSVIAHKSPPSDTNNTNQSTSPSTSEVSRRRQSMSSLPPQHRLSRGTSLADPTVTTPLLARQPSIYVETTIAATWSRAMEDVRLLPFTFWLVCLICVLLYGTVVPFNNIASDFLQSKWFPGDTVMAGNVMCIPDTMSAVLVPICGILVDKYGRRASVLVLCALVIAAVHLILGLTMIYPVFPLIFLGLSYSMYGVAIWPSIATIIQHEEEMYDQSHLKEPNLKLLGTGYGLSTSALNMALTVFPLVAAQVRVWGGSFLPVELFFVSLAVMGAIASAVLWAVDSRNGGVLERPEIIMEHHESDEESEPLLVHITDDTPVNNRLKGHASSVGDGRGGGRLFKRGTSPSAADADSVPGNSGNNRAWLHRNSSTPRFTLDPEEDGCNEES